MRTAAYVTLLFVLTLSCSSMLPAQTAAGEVYDHRPIGSGRAWQNGRSWWNDLDAMLLSGELPLNEFLVHATACYAGGAWRFPVTIFQKCRPIEWIS